jgi:hypothetical protein
MFCDVPDETEESMYTFTGTYCFHRGRELKIPGADRLLDLTISLL